MITAQDGVAVRRAGKGNWRTVCISVKLQADQVFMSHEGLCTGEPIGHALKSQGQRSLAGYSPWGREESDTTEGLSTH